MRGKSTEEEVDEAEEGTQDELKNSEEEDERI